MCTFVARTTAAWRAGHAFASNVLERPHSGISLQPIGLFSHCSNKMRTIYKPWNFICGHDANRSPNSWHPMASICSAWHPRTWLPSIGKESSDDELESSPPLAAAVASGTRPCLLSAATVLIDAGPLWLSEMHRSANRSHAVAVSAHVQASAQSLPAKCRVSYLAHYVAIQVTANMSDIAWLYFSRRRVFARE